MDGEDELRKPNGCVSAQLDRDVEDDDPLVLSSQALAALQEFLADQNKTAASTPPPSSLDGGDDSNKVELVTEDWRLSQFWYEPETAETVAEEVVTLSRRFSTCRVACIACPTLYVYLKKKDPSLQVQLLEYDMRFERYGSEFTFYDYNEPEELPLGLKHCFHIIVADPPYLSKECLERVAQTVSFLASPVDSLLLLLTGDVQRDRAAELLGVRPCVFKPHHSSKLGNEFRLFAGVQTRVSQWWNAIPFLTSSVVVVCVIIYLISLLTGYDSFYEVCFLPSAILSRFQVYRFYTAILFHGSMLHVLFNMMALVPMGSELERIMGSVRLFYLTILLATTNAVLHLLIASLTGYNPFYQYDHLMNECAIGFSGILFSMIVIETSLSGVTSRSMFGLFNVPAKLYPWLLLIAFQLLMTNVSLLGHLCGILSGFAYSYGLFNFLMPGSSFFSTIESASWMASCVRRPKFIMCTGGNPSSYMPTYSVQNTTSSGFSTGNAWRSLSSWLPQREASNQSSEDSRFPGRGRTLSGTARDPTPPAGETDPNLHARLLEDSTPDRLSDATAIGIAEPIPAARQVPIANAAVLPPSQGRVAASEEQIQKLVAMGFERTQVEVALAAADDDLNVAVEILMSQQVETCPNQSSIF
ncbi:unnamed protein product [Brassica napus]|uniref:Protein-lysine N-methyltransferase DARMORV10_C08P33850.1 n=1 Tax=Brassica napus TaxID=3708 RepID=A0A816UET7_BRANA|nr:unnamed protein product [Brassica napus]